MLAPYDINLKLRTQLMNDTHGFGTWAPNFWS